MLPNESQETAALVRQIIEPLGYYNERARREELAKYDAEHLGTAVEEDSHSVLVAKDDQQLLGFCISRYDDGVVWLSWFGVHPAARRHGVGAALLHALGRSLELRKAHKVWCDTRTENVGSATVLEGVGFNKLVELKNHWYGQDFFLWEWYPR